MQSLVIKIISNHIWAIEKACLQLSSPMIRHLHSLNLLLSSVASCSFLCSILIKRVWVTFELHQLLAPFYALLSPKDYELPLNFTILHAPCSPTVVYSSIVFNLLLVSSFSKRRGVTLAFNGRSIFILLWSGGRWRLQELLPNLQVSNPSFQYNFDV